MDGFEPYRPGRLPAAVTPRLPLGLQVPDFDAPPIPEPTAWPAVDAATLEAAERTAMLDTARADGHSLSLAEGLRRASETREHQIAAALEAAAAAMSAAATQASATVEAASEVLARLLLAALDAALPAASAGLTAATVARLATTLRPLLEDVPRLTLTVAPGFAEACAAAIGDARIEVREDAALAPGDARAAWSGGEAVVELARQREAIADVLRAFGMEIA